MASVSDTRVSRRRFGITTGSAPASVAFGEACLVATRTSPESDGRLAARPQNGASRTGRPIRFCQSVSAAVSPPAAAVDGLRHDVPEFEGRHEMPPDIATEGLRWIAAR